MLEAYFARIQASWYKTYYWKSVKFIMYFILRIFRGSVLQTCDFRQLLNYLLLHSLRD